MKLLFRYLKIHIKSIILFSVFAVIFCVVFALSRAPLDAVVYAIILCFALATVIAAAGYFRFAERHRRLEEMRNTITISLERLPQPHGCIESDYDALVRLLFDEKRRAESDFNITLAGMTDYYTLWAHQIKTPIAAMRLLLQSGCDNSELDEQLFKIEQYVDMVLQYIRTESTSGDFVLHRYSLDNIVRSSVRKYAKLFIKKRITLKYEPLNAHAVTDSKWLGFVICQLLDNSIKYTPEGGCISIYMLPDAENTLVVEDSGIGIAPEDLPRVFDKGYTGYNGRAERKSTGIGLYLCRQVARKLSHGISAESEVGRGTRILIDLSSVPITE